MTLESESFAIALRGTDFPECVSYIDANAIRSSIVVLVLFVTMESTRFVAIMLRG